MLRYLKLGFLFSKEMFFYSYVFLGRNLWLLLAIFIVYNFVIFGTKNQGVDFVGNIPVSLYIRYVYLNQLFLVNRRDSASFNDIRSGSIIIYMNKPINYFFYQLCNVFLKNLIKILIGAFVAGIVINFLISNMPWFGLINFILFLISFLMGLLCLSLLNIFMGLFAFKFEEVSFLKLILSKSYFILGGAFFPIDIYPIWLQKVCDVLPFKYFFYCSSNFFVNGNLQFFWSYFPIQIFWLIVIIILNYLFYMKLIKSLEINGG